MSRWTTADIPDQSGRRFVVTGANSGIGFEAARALAGKGAEVVMACRDTARGEAARVGMGGSTQVRRLDLADLDSVVEFAAGLDRVDVLILNAGVMDIPLSRTAAGHEMQFATNVLGHFLLSQLVRPVLTDRVVWLGSIAHRFGSVEVSDLDWTVRPYDSAKSYAQSKLACIVLALEQQRRFIREGSVLRSMAAHPGMSSTNLFGRSGNSFRDQASRFFATTPAAQPAWMGALPELYAATVPDLPGGFYIGPDGIGETRGYPRPVSARASAYDPELGSRLWEACERMTGR
ncbi:NAD(P)-dependent dehydrogenase, short-chain alcohol dehydrogenase family [Austwickia chelonae]|uniref:Putative oxidoreductase n=1 Tax=Austwickia chelonae NBRC 105200 TaxID=1184607 RepID=K6VQW3_9MICO|nr:oxidoreductase [Austwickia chelonae]GAB79124.1 putative oxidoreductase [Austwickia chelonae NBRC 105200]SEW42472.1 NAD(P)-dependent dehydrogenase, short-chain alcohol dehydrogenase family [Austwickia chelonae]